jgi:hypothetical protein
MVIESESMQQALAYQCLHTQVSDLPSHCAHMYIKKKKKMHLVIDRA